MSLIVSLITADNVIMGADSGTYDLDSGLHRASAQPKLFRHTAIPTTGNGLWFLAGCAGSARQRQVYQHGFTPPSPEPGYADLTGYMVTRYAPALRQALEDAHALGDELPLEGTALIAVYGTGRYNIRPHVYELQSDLQVAELTDDWNATGASYETALGALAALAIHGWPAADPPGTVTAVMEVTERYSLFCRSPFRIEHLIED